MHWFFFDFIFLKKSHFLTTPFYILFIYTFILPYFYTHFIESVNFFLNLNVYTKTGVYINSSLLINRFKYRFFFIVDFPMKIVLSYLLLSSINSFISSSIIFNEFIQNSLSLIFIPITFATSANLFFQWLKAIFHNLQKKIDLF